MQVSADEALDRLNDRLSDWESLKTACQVPKLVCYIQRWRLSTLDRFSVSSVQSKAADAAPHVLANVLHACRQELPVNSLLEIQRCHHAC